jgi:hypothetical protein
MNFYLGLVHYPIKNKLGDLVTTSVTNLDIHDISRSCRTFGVKKYFLITPLNIQRELVNSILGHWEQDNANAYNPDRQDALSIAMAVESFEDALNEIEKIEGRRPYVVATGANFENSDGDVSQLTKKAELGNMPCFLLFGTGWGLHPELVRKVDFKLAPICANTTDGYNHLSVRSAVAIYLDRFFGNRDS